MRLAVVNPNSTAAMTDKAVAAARLALPGATVTGHTCDGAPPAIEGPEDGAAAVPHVLATLARLAAKGRTDAAIIACFDDTGLAEGRQSVPFPVLGIGDAAAHAAALLGDRFSVVTTLPVSVPVLEGNLRRSGLAAACVRVRAAGIPVLDFEHHPARAAARLSAEIAAALAEDAPDTIVLGCAGMADLAADLERRHGLPVIDGVAAAALLAEALVRLRHGARARPVAIP
jgi:allantoin racemase